MIANVYLTFNGNCEEAFHYYKKIFGVEFSHISKFKEMPAGEGVPTMSPEDQEKIMHVALMLTPTCAIMGSDTGGEWASNYIAGNNISVSLNATSMEEADRVFNALADGGNVTMPMNQTFWGDCFGMCTDKFGINWMMSYNEQYQPK